METNRPSKRLTSSRQTQPRQSTCKQNETIDSEELKAWIASANLELEELKALLNTAQRGPIGRRLQVARDMLNARRIKKALLGLPGSGKPKGSSHLRSPQSLAIAVAIDYAHFTKSQIMKALDLPQPEPGDPKVSRYLTRRLVQGRKILAELSPAERRVWQEDIKTESGKACLLNCLKLFPTA